MIDKFAVGDRVELTEEAKEMFPTLSRQKGTITGRLPKAEYMPYRVKFDNRKVIESFHRDYLQRVFRQ